MNCPSDYELDAFWLEGKPEDHPVHAHLEGCESCRKRLVEWEQADDKFDREVFPATEEKVVERLSKPSSGFSGFFTYPRLAAAAAVVLAVVLTVALWHPEEREATYIGIKGTLGLEVYCQRADSVFRVNPGDRLLSEDRIRFAVSTPGAGQVMVVSVDRQGEVSLFYPPGPVSGGRTELEGSTILDESQGPERIFVVFSEGILDFTVVESAVERGLKDSGGVENLKKLPLDLAQNSLLIHKGNIGE
jgi:hypothetical protein